MENHEPTNVLTAFEMLLEEVENEIEFVNASGARAFAGGDYAQVDTMRSLAQKLTDFRERAANLRKEWHGLVAQFEPAVDADQSAHREYCIKRVILEIYDEMAAAMVGGVPTAPASTRPRPIRACVIRRRQRHRTHMTQMNADWRRYGRRSGEFSGYLRHLRSIPTSARHQAIHPCVIHPGFKGWRDIAFLLLFDDARTLSAGLARGILYRCTGTLPGA